MGYFREDERQWYSQMLLVLFYLHIVENKQKQSRNNLQVKQKIMST